MPRNNGGKPAAVPAVDTAPKPSAFGEFFGGWQLRKTNRTSPLKQVLISVASILLGLIFCGILLLVTGNNPLALYGQVVADSIGSGYALSETVVKTVPLAFCALGVSLAFRMKLWNIGAEGQFYMGAIGATFFVIYFPSLPVYLMLPLMFLGGCLLGGVWGLVPAIPRALWNVSETISTLLLNYVAMLFTAYLVFGPWKDPKGNNFPLTVQFPASATIPALGGTRITLSVFFMLLLAAVLFFLLKYSKWGFEINVSGASRSAAGYAGMNYFRNVLVVLFISGAIAGFAGMCEVSGVLHRLQQTISPGYGYTAIVVALLARLNPLGILLTSFLMGALLEGGLGLQASGMFSSSIVSMFQGAILLFVLAGEIFNNYRLVRKKA